MDGVHDLGGVEGFGPVAREGPGEPVFRHDWERRAMGLTFCGFFMGLNNGGEFRHSIERMDPVHYLTSRYYEHWATSVATRMVETGRVRADELPGWQLSRPVATTGVVAPPPATEVSVGDEVVVRHITTRGHTRCPGYVRGRRGVVVRVDAPASVPDVEAHSDERRHEPVACVRFDARELWGEDAEEAVVHVDLWTAYLELAG